MHLHSPIDLFCHFVFTPLSFSNSYCQINLTNGDIRRRYLPLTNIVVDCLSVLSIDDILCTKCRCRKILAFCPSHLVNCLKHLLYSKWFTQCWKQMKVGEIVWYCSKVSNRKMVYLKCFLYCTSQGSSTKCYRLIPKRELIKIEVTAVTFAEYGATKNFEQNIATCKQEIIYSPIKKFIQLLHWYSCY